MVQYLVYLKDQEKPAVVEADEVKEEAGGVVFYLQGTVTARFVQVLVAGYVRQET